MIRAGDGLQEVSSTAATGHVSLVDHSSRNRPAPASTERGLDIIRLWEAVFDLLIRGSFSLFESCQAVKSHKSWRRVPGYEKMRGGKVDRERLGIAARLRKGWGLVDLAPSALGESLRCIGTG